MRFEDFINIRLVIPDNCSCKEHTAGFSAYHTRAYHVVADAEIVLGLEVFLDHLTHFLIARHHDVAHIIALFRNINTVFIQHFSLFERSVP